MLVAMFLVKFDTFVTIFFLENPLFTFFLIISVIAEPTTTPSANFEIFFASLEFLMPKPTAIGMLVDFFKIFTSFFNLIKLGFFVPVIPLIDT